MSPPEAQATPTSDRVLQVLAVLAQQGRGISAGELMAHTGLARSTIYRLLTRLKRWGFVVEDEGSYAPGPLSLQLALGFDLSSHLVRQSRQEMIALARQSRESVGIVVAVNDRAICLEMVDSEQALRCSFEKGRSVPLRAGASAKCLLAYLPDSTREAQLAAQYPAPEQRQAAEAELAAIRQAGYAMTAGEVDPGVWGVSAPLFGPGRRAVGAITLMAPVTRAEGQQPALADMTVVTAARISRGLALT
ncbi:MAG: IclR family transcriptional regulator [Burkholderiales bacterium]